ncbi:Signal recognition particle SEC65 subunit [Cyphellophora attinorum]|uniref:Signal recognition particle SEC65 subunit n=1 Tax=Cyphellophora attinorum TaxID=1664694 RepID=A0A0N1P0U6_9EURO|nr:Signal recognition particle SEC65 subunit [Phialophora attinorum]KPI41080.1 Signal recognition particle SEC65 subunit [Phialophora attinorum]
MSHARIEEVSDSDPEIDDPEAFLPDSSQHALQPASAPHSAVAATASTNPTLLRNGPPTSFSAPSHQQSARNNNLPPDLKSHCLLYPVYFDATRTRSTGRRVPPSLAIKNPLAYSLISALQSILKSNPAPSQLQITFEPDKLHPNDWANPGRVRIKLFDTETHKPLHPGIKSKAHLYKLIGEYLVANPTQKDSPLDLRIQGLPIPENFLEESGEVKPPRGWKMGTILPVHSAAVSGGGVSENFLKEAMEEMKAMGGAPGAGGMPGAGGGGMPDMAALQSMMGGMGGLGGMMGGGGGGPSGGGAIEGGGGGKKGKGKKK